MPALPVVANTLRLQLKHTMGSDVDVLNRIFLAYTGTAPTSTGLNSMASACETAWVADLKPLCFNDVTLTEIIIEDLTSSSGGLGTWSGSSAGSRSGTELSAGTATLVNFSIARRYRGGKPRCYFPFGVSGDLNGPNAWQSSFLTAVLSGYNSFVTGVIAAAPSGTTITGQVNVSYYEGFTNFTGPTGRIRARSTVKSGAELPIVPDPVTAVTVNGKPASQRRRNTQKR